MATGRLVLTPFQVPTAANINGYLADRGIMRFASTAARSSAIPTPEVGMVTWRDNLPGYEYWSGSAWVAFSFTSPAQTVQGMSSVQTFSAMTIGASTAANTWSSWQNIGTSPGSTSFLTGMWVNGGSGLDQPTVIVVELSRDAGATVHRRFILQCNYGATYPSISLISGRSCAASSTLHARFKMNVTASVSGTSITLAGAWTQTAPAIALSAAESLWETTSTSAGFGTWTTLGTVSGSHRLVAAAMYGTSDVGIATGASNTILARWLTPAHAVVLYGHNRAVPSGALKASGYSGSWAWVLTEPV